MNKIKELRAEKGLTQAQLAEILVRYGQGLGKQIHSSTVCGRRVMQNRRQNAAASGT